jgi:hypothetical protein
MITFLYRTVDGICIKRSIAGDLHLADIPTGLVFTASDICSGLFDRIFNLHHTLLIWRAFP